MPDATVTKIAKDMITKFGVEEAWSIANAKLLARVCACNRMEARFWADIGSTIWDMGRASLEERREMAMASAA